MSSTELVPRRERWTISATKMYGWLTGVAFSVFGGLMCAVPIGAVFGLPGVAFGLFLVVTFAISMSASSASLRWTWPLVLLAVAFMVYGRMVAPIDEVIESFQTNRTINKSPGMLGSFGIPLMLLGLSLMELVVPWIRREETLGYVRSFLSMLLIEAGGIALLVGEAMTKRAEPSWKEQPYSLWLAVPLALAIGVGLRCGWRRPSWIVMLFVVAIPLPLTWQLLLR